MNGYGLFSCVFFLVLVVGGVFIFDKTSAEGINESLIEGVATSTVEVTEETVVQKNTPTTTDTTGNNLMQSATSSESEGVATSTVGVTEETVAQNNTPTTTDTTGNNLMQSATSSDCLSTTTSFVEESIAPNASTSSSTVQSLIECEIQETQTSDEQSNTGPIEYIEKVSEDTLDTTSNDVVHEGIDISTYENHMYPVEEVPADIDSCNRMIVDVYDIRRAIDCFETL